ncbi:SDR family oxidoreductase [Thalassotalea psychrophila]|uniref:SDR family oxidoreductase n=1 Tax=Thalassotalea psychrophila TaxID=3065647 RepID=A0ABY9TWN6_9GAMM|nr:SDR family oxidoreductase [Colwelliaceae bacterium SQ149]
MQRQNIIITGASSGLGYTMAQQFAKLGRNLILCARRIESLKQLKVELEEINSSIEILIVELDVNDHEQVFKVFKEAKDKFGSIDRVIVNAGIGKGASLGTGYFKANKETAMTNFVAALAQCEAALEIFREQNFGHLVTISSVSSQKGFRGAFNVYAATKAAIASLTEGIRIDLLNTPIKVTTIHPGYIRTEISHATKKQPFTVDVETGCKTIVKAIEKEVNVAFVPTWPWAMMRYVLPMLPLSVMRKFS